MEAFRIDYMALQKNVSISLYMVPFYFKVPVFDIMVYVVLLVFHFHDRLYPIDY